MSHLALKKATLPIRFRSGDTLKTAIEMFWLQDIILPTAAGMVPLLILCHMHTRQYGITLSHSRYL
jgi:hypothetical protein